MEHARTSAWRDPLLDGITTSGAREPQRRLPIVQAGNLVTISADGHWEISEDIFHDRFPAHLRDQAPRVWFDRYWRIGYPGEMEAYGSGSTLDDAIERCIPSGVWDRALRARHMEIEGIDQEIVFPQSLLGFIRYRNLEVQEWIYRIYNDYIAEISRASGGRFHGVGVLSNWWDPSKAEAAVRQIVDLGLKTFLLPTSPGKNAAGQPINYAAAEMAPLWNAITAAGLPVNFHVGENGFIQEGPGALGAYELVALAPFRKPLGELIFGGVFDRHPQLQIVFAEGGLGWIAPALQDAEMIVDSFTDLLQPRLRHRPSYYWHNNCHATFQNDLLGLRLIDDIGADRVMWANDYPHTEGSFGFSSGSMQSVVRMTTPDDAAKILGGNAARLYRL